MDANTKLEILRSLYRKAAIEAAEDLFRAVNQFLADPDDRNTASLRISFEELIRNKTIVDTMVVHKD